MNSKTTLFFIVAIFCFVSCRQNSKLENNISLSPDAGTSYKAGEIVPLKVSNPDGSKPDSIVYLVDSVKVGLIKKASTLSLRTDSMQLGVRVVTAKSYTKGTMQEASTNIVLLAAKPPEQMTYKIEKVFPHDTTAYTEGLLYQDGFIYESTGDAGHSTLRKVDVTTGRVVKMKKLDSKYFGEGISIVGNKIIMLTYKQPEKAFVFDKNTFDLLSTFDNNVGEEGWGMTFDGKKLYFDDRTNRIWFLDKDNYRQIGFIDVYTDKAPVDSVNELEYINGKLYSNIYQKENILIINPKTGAVLQSVDMNNLWPLSKRPKHFDNSQNVLNGIAWDEKGKRLFVTGKKWPHLYQVEFVKK